MEIEDAPRFVRHRTCQALTELTLSQLPRDRSLGSQRRHSKGATIWRPDGVADSICFLSSGRVEVLVDDLDGCEVLLRHIEAGEPFGELCICSGKDSVRFTHARAVSDSEVLEIKLDDFLHHLRESETALESLVFTFCKRLADAEHRIEVLSHRGADERLARLLLQLASPQQAAKSATPDRILVHVTHDELAKMAAMTRSHVTVTMVKYRQLGLVHYGSNQPLTVDVPTLQAYVADRTS